MAHFIPDKIFDTFIIKSNLKNISIEKTEDMVTDYFFPVICPIHTERLFDSINGKTIPKI